MVPAKLSGYAFVAASFVTLGTLGTLGGAGIALTGCTTDPVPDPGDGGAPIDASGDSKPVVDAGFDGNTSFKAVRFVTMGDTGRGNSGQSRIANAVSAKCKKDGCDFVQLLGDNIYETGASSVDDPLWMSRFETPYVAIDLHFFAVLGNHDYGADGAGTDFQKGKNQVDYTKKSKKWKMPAPYFHYVKENVEIFALDTNMQMFGQAAAQTVDVKEWLAASKAEWKIAVGHHPYKSNGPHGNAGTYDAINTQPYNGVGVKTFMDDVICGNVDVYFSGHDHSQQWLNESCSGTELAVSGAGALTTELSMRNPSLYQSLELGFLYIVIDGKKLTAEFIAADGSVEFTHTITKP